MSLIRSGLRRDEVMGENQWKTLERRLPTPRYKQRNLDQPSREWSASSQNDTRIPESLPSNADAIGREVRGTGPDNEPTSDPPIPRAAGSDSRGYCRGALRPARGVVYAIVISAICWLFILILLWS